MTEWGAWRSSLHSSKWTLSLGSYDSTSCPPNPRLASFPYWSAVLKSAETCLCENLKLHHRLFGTVLPHGQMFQEPGFVHTMRQCCVHALPRPWRKVPGPSLCFPSPRCFRSLTTGNRIKPCRREMTLPKALTVFPHVCRSCQFSEPPPVICERSYVYFLDHFHTHTHRNGCSGYRQAFQRGSDWAVILRPWCVTHHYLAIEC